MKNSPILNSISAFVIGLASLNAQVLETNDVHPNITFENEEFNLNGLDYWDGSDGSGDFTIYTVTFNNEYSSDLDYWSAGWAISRVNDTTTPGFENLYGNIAGQGAFQSSQFVVGQNKAYIKTDYNMIAINFYLTNSTYAALSMRDGDMVAKKFGGDSGNDPDYFKLNIKTFKNGLEVGTPYEIYLADFRFEDNSEDYILNTWEYFYFDFFNSPADSLVFELESSDVGEFGMNTPVFFCVDNFNVIPFSNSIENNLTKKTLSVFPNPSKNELNIDLSQVNSGTLSIFNIDGKKVMSETFGGEMEIKKMDVSSIENGFYVVEILTSKNERMVGRFVKND